MSHGFVDGIEFRNSASTVRNDIKGTVRCSRTVVLPHLHLYSSSGCCSASSPTRVEIVLSIRFKIVEQFVGIVCNSLKKRGGIIQSIVVETDALFRTSNLILT